MGVRVSVQLRHQHCTDCAGVVSQRFQASSSRIEVFVSRSAAISTGSGKLQLQILRHHPEPSASSTKLACCAESTANRLGHSYKQKACMWPCCAVATLGFQPQEPYLQPCSQVVIHAATRPSDVLEAVSARWHHQSHVVVQLGRHLERTGVVIHGDREAVKVSWGWVESTGSAAEVKSFSQWPCTPRSQAVKSLRVCVRR